MTPDNPPSAPSAPATDEAAIKYPAEQDTHRLVRAFSAALMAKLGQAEVKYGFTNGWATEDWEAECQRQLLAHVAKGDPLDVAAYAAFCWARGWSTASAPQSDEARFQAWMRETNGSFPLGSDTVEAMCRSAFLAGRSSSRPSPTVERREEVERHVALAISDGRWLGKWGYGMTPEDYRAAEDRSLKARTDAILALAQPATEEQASFPGPLVHKDACALSLYFNRSASLSNPQHYRINEWLKSLIEHAPDNLGVMS